MCPRWLITAILVGLPVLAGLGVWLWFEIAYPTYTYHFRLMLAIDVDGETKSGSSVIEVRNRKQPQFGSAVFAFVFSEAVYVDLGPRGNVIAILGFGPSGGVDRLGALATRQFGLSLEYADLKRLHFMRGTAELTSEDIPTFGDSPGRPAGVAFQA